MSSPKNALDMPSRVATGAYRAARFFLSHEALVRSVAFRSLYFGYKRLLADPFARLPNYLPDVYSGGFIIDVGANIGYTSSVFQRYVDQQRAVFAFEPESSNFFVLSNLAKTWRNVEPLRLAVGDTCGEVVLLRNSFHPGDHKVVRGATAASPQALSNSERCSCTTLDAFLLSRRIEPAEVRFLKIDVQGFEPAVLAGARTLLQSSKHLTMALEFDAPAMQAMGFSPQDLLDEIRSYGFSLHRLRNSGAFDPLPAVAPRAACDILCLRQESADNSGGKYSGTDRGAV